MCATAGQQSRWPRFTVCQRTPLPVWKHCALKRSALRTAPCFSSFTHTPLYPLLFLFHFSFMFILLSALFCIYEHVINWKQVIVLTVPDSSGRLYNNLRFRLFSIMHGCNAGLVFCCVRTVAYMKICMPLQMQRKIRAV